MICPDCKGQKGSYGLTFHRSGCGPRWIPCHRCKETGEVSDEMPRWIETGRRLRAWREAQDRSMGEEARRRGISVVDLSDFETGKREPVFPAAYVEPAVERVEG